MAFSESCFEDAGSFKCSVQTFNFCHYRMSQAFIPSSVYKNRTEIALNDTSKQHMNFMNFFQTNRANYL